MNLQDSLQGKPHAAPRKRESNKTTNNEFAMQYINPFMLADNSPKTPEIWKTDAMSQNSLAEQTSKTSKVSRGMPSFKSFMNRARKLS